MQRIAIDMDEVLADTAAHQLAWYVREFGPGPTAAELHGAPGKLRGQVRVAARVAQLLGMP